MRKLFIYVALSLLIQSFSNKSEAQSKSIRLGFEFPFQVAVGFENQFHEWFSFHGQFGVLTLPLDKPLMSELRIMGFSRDATDILEPVLDFGTVAGGGFRFYFNKHTLKNYVGPLFFYVNNYKSDITDVGVSKYFNHDMNNFPLGPQIKALSSEPLTFTSKFMQVGLQYGYRVKLNRDDREVRLEFNISKNVWSKHDIESDYRYLGDFKKTVNNHFKDLYKRNAIISTVNIYYIFKTEYKRF
jgi:hypothetical protein